MFRKLRNKLVALNLGVTTVVILVTFAIIYMTATREAAGRQPIPDFVKFESTTIDSSEELGEEFREILTFTVREEKAAAAQNLLRILIFSGIAIEVAVLIISYVMAEQAIKPVKEAYETQKVFIANASHEIKTPLAAISANLEAADIQGDKWIENVEAETAKLARLNSELLTLARTDLVESGKVAEVDAGKVVKDVLRQFEPRMQKIKLTQEVSEPMVVKTVRADLEQILTILIDNAVKYCDKKIVVTAKNREIVIKNDGAQLTEEQAAHVFERFYQTDKTADGVGLGLSIAQSLAERNRWTLTARGGEMTEFRLKL